MLEVESTVQWRLKKEDGDGLENNLLQNEDY